MKPLIIAPLFLVGCAEEPVRVGEVREAQVYWKPALTPGTKLKDIKPEKITCYADSAGKIEVECKRLFE